MILPLVLSINLVWKIWKFKPQMIEWLNNVIFYLIIVIYILLCYFT